MHSPAPTVIDGAMGTELLAAGLELGGPLGAARACLDDPERVVAVHRAYRAAGASVLTANTFMVNRIACERVGTELGTVVAAAVECVRRAMAQPESATAPKSSPILAGSLAPLDPALGPRARASSYRETAEALRDAGCDLVFAETMTSAAEANLVLEALAGLGCPLWISVVAGTDGRSVAGDGLDTINGGSCDAVLLGCTPLEAAPVALPALSRCGAKRLGAVTSNGGIPGSQVFAPTSWAKMMLALPTVALLGGCCGTRPAHIRALHHSD